MSRQTKQQGSTLVVTLIFLVLMSLFAVNAFNSSSTNLRVVGNMEARQESMAAAQLGVEQTISSTLFASNPDGVAANALPVDINGDGSADLQVRMLPKPSCYRVLPIKTVDLNPALNADLSCMRSGALQNSGLDSPDVTAAAGDSMCSQSEWNIRAEVVDARTGTMVAVNQGVGLRVLGTDAANSCN
jgi:hypothetical protein